MNPPALFVFDLDGTLIDSRTDLANAANAALERLGLPRLSKEVIVSYIGDGIDALLRRCLTEERLNLFERARSYFGAYYREHLLDHTTLLPEVRETLEILRRQSQLAVLTNKSEPYARRILEGLGVASLFTVIVGERNGKVTKPDPEVLKALTEQLGVSSNATLMVGDGENDILVARAVGCRSCAIADSGEKRHLLESFGPDFLIHKMGELLGIFEDLHKKSLNGR